MEFLLNYDRYGYNIGIDEVTKELNVMKLVAAYHNRQYPDNLDDLRPLWGISEYESQEAAEKDQEIGNCGVAWENGMDRCQCGHKDCPRYE